MILFLISSAAINFLFAVLFYHFLPVQLRQNKWPIILLFLSIGLFIPVLGTFCVGIASILLFFFHKPTKISLINVAQIPKFMRKKITEPPFLGAGDAWTELHASNISVVERLKILTAVNVAHTKQANILNQEVLHDKDDELRLYAFSLLENQKKDIHAEINMFLEKLKTSNTEYKKAKCEKYLALLYWKLIELNLVREDLLQDTLVRSLYYARSAIKQLINDISLWILLGQIYLYKKDEKKALTSFNKAAKFKAPDDKILLYLAELSFRERNFMKMREYLNKNCNLKDISNLKPILRFWGVVC